MQESQETNDSSKCRRVIKKPTRYETTDSDEISMKKKQKSSKRLAEMSNYFNSLTKTVSRDSEEEMNSRDSANDSNDESETEENREIESQMRNINTERKQEYIGKSNAKSIKNRNGQTLQLMKKSSNIPQNSFEESGHNNSDVSLLDSSEKDVLAGLSTSDANYYSIIVSELIKSQLSQKVTEVKEYVNIKIDEVKEHINMKLQEVSSSLNNRLNMKRKITPPDCFPLRTMEDFEEFERNDEVQIEATEYFMLWGGEDLKTTTRKFLKEALADDLAICFKYYVDKENTENNDPNNKILYKTKLNQVICHACLETFRDMTIEQFTAEMQNALRASKQRYRDKKNQTKKKHKGDDPSEDRLRHLRELENRVRNRDN